MGDLLCISALPRGQVRCPHPWRRAALVPLTDARPRGAASPRRWRPSRRSRRCAAGTAGPVFLTHLGTPRPRSATIAQHRAPQVAIGKNEPPFINPPHRASRQCVTRLVWHSCPARYCIWQNSKRFPQHGGHGCCNFAHRSLLNCAGAAMAIGRMAWLVRPQPLLVGTRPQSSPPSHRGLPRTAPWTPPHRPCVCGLACARTAPASRRMDWPGPTQLSPTGRGSGLRAQSLRHGAPGSVCAPTATATWIGVRTDPRRLGSGSGRLR